MNNEQNFCKFCATRPVSRHTPCFCPIRPVFVPYALFCATRPERAEAPSPGHRPGLLRALAYRPVRAKALKLQAKHKAFALTGRVFKIRLKSDAFIT